MIRIYKLGIPICICLYIISGILNFFSFDFCGNHANPFAFLFSFCTYVLFFIITEIAVFLNKNIDHLRFFLLFWAIHLCIFAISIFFPNLGLVLFLLIVSPSIEIFNTFTGKWHTFIFPFLCFMMVIQLLSILLWHKYIKQKT